MVFRFPMTRRSVLTASSGLAVGAFSLSRTAFARDFESDPFTLGTASGDPRDTSVVLWTRLAPTPLAPDGGMEPVPVPIICEIYADDALKRLVRVIKSVAEPTDAHSVRIIADNLQPNRHYWYRFGAGGSWSGVGRARTLPSPNQPVSRFRMASAGCQSILGGYYTLWNDIAEKDFDLVFHYGDYIYETRLNGAIDARIEWPLDPAQYKRPASLTDYRLRYSLYKLDKDLQAAHRAHTFLLTYDDHEVSDDWAGDNAPKLDQQAFLQRREAALRAYYEHMPVRDIADVMGAASYQARQIGRLINLTALNTRLYRSKWACGTTQMADCPERAEAARTMLGRSQEDWLIQQLNSDRPWNLICQQSPMMEIRYSSEDGRISYNMDIWDGYKATRDRFFEAVATSKITGLIVLTGALHSAAAGELRQDFENPESPALGAEFVSSSISTKGESVRSSKFIRRMLQSNPSIKFFDGRRGYVECDIQTSVMNVRYNATDTVATRGAPVYVLKEYTLDPSHVSLT